MNVKRIALLGVPVLALAALLPLSATARGSQHVRWDIVSLVGGGPPGPLNPGGMASAKAPDGDTITLTGHGTFVAPNGSNGGAGAATGGGTGGAPSGRGADGVKERVDRGV